MKQVNKSFLEEQVRSLLKEKSNPDKEEPSKIEQGLDAAKHLGTLYLIGDPQGYKDQANWLSANGAYGWGSDKYYKLVLDKIGDIEKESNQRKIPYSQLMLRFYRTSPVGPDQQMNPKTLNLMPNEELAKELIDIRNWAYQKLLGPIKNNDTDAAAKVLKTVGYSNNTSFEFLGGLDESIDDVASTYGFKRNINEFYGIKNKALQKTLFKDPKGLDKVGMYQEFAKDIVADGANPNTLLNNIEKFIMFHFNGLEDVGFKKAMLRLQFNSNLPMVAMAHLAYQEVNDLGAKALIGFLDTSTALLSTAATTVAIVASFATAGAASPLILPALALKVGQKTGIEAIKKMVLKAGNSKIINSISTLQDSKTYATTIGRFQNLKYQLSPLIFELGRGVHAAVADYRNDIMRKNEEFFKNYGKATPEERAGFYESEIKPSLEYVSKVHAKLLMASQVDPEYLSVRVLNLDVSKKAYIEFNKEYILKMEKNIKDMTAKLEILEKQSEEITSQFEKVEKRQEEIKAANEKGENTMKNPEFVLPMPKAFETASTPPVKKQPEVSQQADLKQTSFGSNEKTSDEILKDIVQALEGPMNEQKDSNIVSVNIGYKDALEYAKGNKDFSPEKTKANMDKIASVLTSKGKKANFTPVAKAVDLPNDADKGKFDSFIKDINSHIQTKKASSMVQPVSNTSAQATSGKVDAKQLAKDDVIIIGDSNSMPFSRRWFKRGKPVKKKGGVYLLDGDNIVSPSVSGGTVPTILATTKKFFQQKGESYKPSIAIIHMGYNAPGSAFPAYQETINLLKQKGVRDIRVVDIKVAGNTYATSEAGEKAYMSRIQKVSEKIRALSGVTIIANNEENNIKGDKIHFTSRAYNNLYNAAMSGITASSTQPSKTAAAGDVKVKNPRATEMISDVQNFLGRRLSDSETQNLENIYKAVISELSFIKDKDSWNAYRYAVGTKESGRRYDPYKESGSWRKNRYTGRYAIGPYPYKVGKQLVSKYGVVLPDYKYIGGSKWSEGSQQKFYEDPIAQEGAFAGFAIYNKNRVKGIAKDTKDELGLPGIAHNIGPGGMKIWARNRDLYRQTKDTKYLYRMWSLQDGYGTPGENFMRILLRQTGQTIPDLPLGWMWQGKNRDYNKLEQIKQFDPKLGDYIEKGWPFCKKSCDPRIWAFTEDDYAERVWNWIMNSGQAYRSGKNSKKSKNIQDYYNENGDPIGSPSGGFSVGTSTPVGADTQTPQQAGTGTQDQSADTPETQMTGGPNSVGKIQSAKDYDSLFGLTWSIFDITSGAASTNLPDLIIASRRLNGAGMERFMKGRIDHLKSIHSMNRTKWKQEYEQDIKLAAGDPRKIEDAEAKQAWYHRPVFFTQVMPSGFRDFFSRRPRITFGFETTTNRVSTSYAGKEIFYDKDTQNNTMYKKFIEDLKVLRDAFRVTVEKYRELKSTDEEQYKMNINVEKYFSLFIQIIDKALPVLENPSAPASRKAFLINVIDQAFRTN